MADLFSIINTLQNLEKAYIREVVTPQLTRVIHLVRRMQLKNENDSTVVKR